MKRNAIILSLVLASQALWAQNLNPEVHVTNEYQTRINDVSKKGVDMTIPDSLYRFDYHFDYSVFDSPYKGAYEFSPYSVTITPDPRPYDGRKLYLRGGAGYTLKPQLDVVWAAVDRKKVSLNVFASGKGYYGRYKHINPGTFELSKKQFDKGWDFGTSAGVDARFNVGSMVIRTEAGYDGIYTGHEIYHRDNCHAPYISARVGNGKGRYLSYSAGVKYRYVYDWLNGTTPVKENELSVEATIAPQLSADYTVSSDVELNLNGFYKAAQIHPHAIFQLGPVDFDAGARLGWYTSHFTISPAITATAHLFHDYLDVYAGAEGGNRNLTYWDYKSRAHRYHLNYVEPRPVREIADLFAGFRGHADFGLQYEAKGGYKFMKNAPFWAVNGAGTETIMFQDCKLIHADILLAWASERFNLDGSVHYVHVPGGVAERVFEPSAFNGTLKGGYNWKKRIYAGLSVDMATSRKAKAGGKNVKVPGYVDVGLWGEYKYNKRLSFWLEGGNLLNHDVRLSPLYSECGPSIIVGACFTL